MNKSRKQYRLLLEDMYGKKHIITHLSGDPIQLFKTKEEAIEFAEKELSKYQSYQIEEIYILTPSNTGTKYTVN